MDHVKQPTKEGYYQILIDNKGYGANIMAFAYWNGERFIMGQDDFSFDVLDFAPAAWQRDWEGMI